MASPGGQGQRETFDDVLLAAKEREHARLERYRVRWVVQNGALLLVSTWVLVTWAPTLVDPDPGGGGWMDVIGWVLGGWLAWAVVVVMTVLALLVFPIALGRIIAVVRTGDLAAYERDHAPWWTDRFR